MTGERLLTTREVAERLAVSPETVLRRWRAGEIPGFRLAPNVLRFQAADVDAWLAGKRARGGANASQHHPRPGGSVRVASQHESRR